MTERDWLSGAHPGDMLAAVAGWLPERRLWLFLAACLRHPDLAEHLAFQNATDLPNLVERVAADPANAVELATALGRIHERLQGRGHQHRPRRLTPGVQADRALRTLVAHDALGSAERFVVAAFPLLGADLPARLAEVVGNPYREVVLPPGCLDWDGGLVRNLAASIAVESAFDRLPILGDALEDAGCTDAALLAHLRSTVPHALGCWALDAVLGRLE